MQVGYMAVPEVRGPGGQGKFQQHQPRQSVFIDFEGWLFWQQQIINCYILDPAKTLAQAPHPEKVGFKASGLLMGSHAIFMPMFPPGKLNHHHHQLVSESSF